MAVLSALGTAGSAVRRNPVVLAAAAIYGLVYVPTLLLQASGSVALNLLGSGYSFLALFVAPFIAGGVLAMANEAIDGRTDWRMFVTGGKQNYLRILVAALLYGVVSLIVGVALSFVAFAVVLAGSGVGAGGGLVIAVALLFGGVVALALFVAGFFLQFYPHAVVVEGYGVADAFKRSAGLVRNHFASALGYTALLVALSVGIGVASFLASLLVLGGGALLEPAGVGGAAGAPGPATSGPSLVVLAGYAVGYVVMSGVVGGYVGTYSVAFYRELLDAESE